jgi:hypothetical protein
MNFIVAVCNMDALVCVIMNFIVAVRNMDALVCVTDSTTSSLVLDVLLSAQLRQ